MKSGNQAAMMFTILMIVYALFDYFVLRGNGFHADPGAEVIVPAQPAPNYQSTDR